VTKKATSDKDVAAAEGTISTRVEQKQVEKRQLPTSRLVGSVEIGFPYADKVNSLWPNPQLLIVLHSPNPYWKPDCSCAFRRRAGTVPHSMPSIPFSAVRFVWE
jgi:hypothetical protein